VKKESASCSRLKTPQSSTLPGEFERRRVVQNENVFVLGAAPRRHAPMGLQDAGEADVVAVDESIQCGFRAIVNAKIGAS
jgi:hypothetical protein